MFRFTGHPFVDAGIAGMAALLEQKGKRINSPEELTEADIRYASKLLCQLYANKIAKEEKFWNDDSKKLPLCTHLLQEVMPGSSWDQAKGKPDSQIILFNSYVADLLNRTTEPAIGCCFLTGTDAHIRIGKSAMPLLASATERPNSFPNLAEGYSASAWVALAVLASPLSIEKTVKADGNGSACLIYHSAHWRFMVEIAHQNLRRIQAILASNSIDSYRSGRYKGKWRSGTWKMALLTMLHALNRMRTEERPQISVWSFNASNQSCRYECAKMSEAILELHITRQSLPGAYRELPRCSEPVSHLLLEGKSIAAASIIEREAKRELKNADRLTRTLLQPGWALQRLYAEKVLKMPSRLLYAVEQAAEHLANDSKAFDYLVFGEKNRISPRELTGRYKLPGELCAVFADYPGLWEDYLRAATLWKGKGKEFPKAIPIADDPGELEMLIKQVAQRLLDKHQYRYKRLAMMLSVQIPHRYREKWIELLRDGACTWEDFLAFNPLDEALSIGKFYQTKIRRDYLVAYLLACANVSGKQAGEDEIPVDEVLDSEHLFEVIEEEE